MKRIAKVMMYLRAPVKTFVLFHPVRALKLFLAFLVGKMLFGRRKPAGKRPLGATGEAGAIDEARTEVPGPAGETGPDTAEPPADTTG